MISEILNLAPDDRNNLMDIIIKENLDRRILVLNDEIDDSIIENYILYILKWNAEDRYVPEEERQEIKIYINCVGGACIDGFNFVDVIQASKTKVKTICFGLAASMGYHIYLAGKERIAFPNSVFLQHDGEIVLNNTSSKAKDTMRFFDCMEARAKKYVLSRTSMTEEFYDKIYDQEYYFYADEGVALGCVDKIIGVDCTIEEIL